MKYVTETPYNKRNFHIDTFEVNSTSEVALKETDCYAGHYTLKVSPGENPKPLLQHGFYYMDTLLRPVCEKGDLVHVTHEDTVISTDYDPKDILRIAETVFKQGRFHRDFNIPSRMADVRYRNWVGDLIEKELLFALYFNGEVAGFYGYEGNNVLLLGIDERFRGQGLAKYFTSAGCLKQFNQGHDKLQTSISASNTASLNLFYMLGFRLKGAVDVYHKLTGPAPKEV